MENIGAKYYKTCWLYIRTKITMQVHKFPLCIVNDTVMIVIEHTNLSNPVFKLYLNSFNIKCHLDDACADLKVVRRYEHTHSAHLNMLESL